MVNAQKLLGKGAILFMCQQPYTYEQVYSLQKGFLLRFNFLVDNTEPVIFQQGISLAASSSAAWSHCTPISSGIGLLINEKQLNLRVVVIFLCTKKYLSGHVTAHDFRLDCCTFHYAHKNRYENSDSQRIFTKPLDTLYILQFMGAQPLI